MSARTIAGVSESIEGVQTDKALDADPHVEQADELGGKITRYQTKVLSSYKSLLILAN